MDRAMPKKELTHKQQLFIKEYLIDFNGTQAAIRAGYSKNSAQPTASENLSKPIIQKELSKAIAKKMNKADITVEYVLDNIKGIIDNRKAKDNDRLKGLELLGKYLKLFFDKIEHSGESKTEVIVYVPDNKRNKKDSTSTGPSD